MRSLQALFAHPWIQQLGWTLVQFLWQGTVLSVLYILVRALLPRGAGARLRYGLACSTLGVMTLAPIVTFGVRVVSPPAAAWTIATPALWQVALPWIVGAWFLGVVVSVTFLVGGWRVTERLKATRVSAPPHVWQRRFDALVARMRIARPVRFLISSIIDVPMVLGCWRPVILLPAAALTGLPPAQIESLLAHELAHVRRLDYLVNVLQRVAEALLFYHPAVWWVSAQVRAEREACCDDLAVETSGDLVTYVRALAELESRRTARPAQALAADGGSLLDRIRRLAGQTPLAHAYPGAGALVIMSGLWIAGVGAIGLNAAAPVLTRPTELVTPAETPAVATLAPLPSPPITVEPLRRSLATTLFLGPIGPAPLAFGDQLPRTPATAVPASTEGQKPAAFGPSQSPAPVDTGLILGQVIDAATKKPVPDVVVSLASPLLRTPRRVLTTPQGQFVFSGLAKGAFSVTATKPGWVEGGYERRRPNGSLQVIDLPDGGRVTDVTISMWRNAAITGSVLDERGSAIPGMEIRALRRGYLSGRAALLAGGSSFTDDRGEFRLDSLVPGTYVVVVPSTQTFAQPSAVEGVARAGAVTASAPRADGALMIDGLLLLNSVTMPLSPGGRALRRYPTTFYPSAFSTSQATSVTLTAGEEFSANIQLSSVPTARVSGVVAHTGAGVSGLVLRLVPASTDEGVPAIDVATTISGPAGRFAFPTVSAGRYVLRVGNPPGARGIPIPGSGPAGFPNTLALSAVVPLSVGDVDVSNVEVVLRAAITFSGRVAYDGVAPRPSGPRLRVNALALEPLDGSSPGVTLGVGEDGRFTAAGLPPGKYVLRMTQSLSGWWFKSAAVGGRDVSDGQLELAATDLSDVLVTLTDRPTEISGTVTGASGFDGGITVVAYPVTSSWLPVGSSPLRLKLARVDRSGAFTITGLPPGDYYVVAVPEEESEKWADPAARTSWSRAAERTRLGSGEAKGLTLRVQTVNR